MDKSIQEIKFIKDKAHARSALEEVVIKGTQKMLKLALENEVDEFIQKYSALKDDGGRRIVSRNGYMPERDILTGVAHYNKATKGRRSQSKRSLPGRKTTKSGRTAICRQKLCVFLGGRGIFQCTPGRGSSLTLKEGD